MTTNDPQTATRSVQTLETQSLAVSGVSHSFGDLSVLSDVSFGVEAGTVACLVGPNGSGKTTLLRVVAGLLTPDEGTVSVRQNDEETASVGSDGERAIGYLAQRPAFRPQFTVAETVSFYASLVGTDTDVDAVLDSVGLSPVADRRIRALSGGMVRLLGIAQTTIGDPPLVVLDEPSSGLDPVMTRHITDVIADLKAGGDAVLLATHDLRSVERIADEVLVLDRGQLVATGPPARLLEETGTETLEDALETLTATDRASVTAGGRGGESE
jgi:heme ABC exporter ATP-binding subunit CcmA